MYRSRFFKPPVVHCLGLLVLLVVSAACSTADAEAVRKPVSVPIAPQGDVRHMSLEDVIASGLQGAQLDVYGGGVAQPGGSTSIFVHRGNRAAEVYWTTDGWCLSRVYTWSVTHAASSTDFDVEYHVDQEYTDCVMDWGPRLVLHVSDVDHLIGHTTYVGAYTTPFTTATVRTTCTSRWDIPSPCGFGEVLALVPDL